MTVQPLHVVPDVEEVTPVSREEEIRNPGVNSRGIIKKAAYLIYKRTGCEDAERNWFNASKAFLMVIL